jgi:hypothetical protein
MKRIRLEPPILGLHSGCLNYAWKPSVCQFIYEQRQVRMKNFSVGLLITSLLCVQLSDTKEDY